MLAFPGQEGRGRVLLEDIAKRLVSLIEERPLLFAVLLLGLVLVACLAWLLRTPVMRQAFRKLYYLTRNMSIGWRDLLYWLFIGVCIALPLALIRGYGKAGDNTFHWAEFWTVLGIVAASNAGRAVFEPWWTRENRPLMDGAKPAISASGRDR